MAYDVGMSVQVNTYVLWGAILDFKSVRDLPGFDDVMEPCRDDGYGHHTKSHDGITPLVDGMDGRYVALGHVIARSDEGWGLDSPVSLPDDLPFREDVESELWKIAERLGLDSLPSLRWHVISHYR